MNIITMAAPDTPPAMAATGTAWSVRMVVESVPEVVPESPPTVEPLVLVAVAPVARVDVVLEVVVTGFGVKLE
jgi:hypothetical protein